MKYLKKNIWSVDKLKSAVFYLSILIIIYILTFLTHTPDCDLWARLAVGSVFFQTGGILKHDIFSYLPTKKLWIDHEWGSGVIFYGMAKYFGEWGFFIIKAGIILLIFLLVIKIIKKQTDKKSAGIFYMMFLGFSLFPGTASIIRCQMFTYLFFTLWIYELERIRLGNKKRLWIFPCTMLLWVNLHGGFLSGIGLVLIYAVGELLNRKNPLQYFKILLMILPVTLINPFGFKLWEFIISASLMPRPYIPEWQPISLNGPFQMIMGFKIHILSGFMLFVLLTSATAVKQLAQKEKPDWTKYMLTAVLLYLSIRHQRHVVFFILAVSGLFYKQYAELFDPIIAGIGKKLSGKYRKVWSAAKYGSGYVLLAIIFLCIMPLLYFHLILNPKEYPYGSMEFIKQNNISGNLATRFSWSSYAFWKLYPNCKILIDGRYEEVYPDSVFNEAILFSEKKGKWYEVINKYHTDIVILPKNLYTPIDMQMLPGWDLAYQDFISVVLVPKDKIKLFNIVPDYKNPAYLKEDYSRQIRLN
jgi:hypothetical protein